MSRSVSFFTLFSFFGLTWITESLVSRKKKRVRKSVIHVHADRHGTPHRSLWVRRERYMGLGERENESEECGAVSLI